MCLKKVPTFKLSITLSNLNRFSKYLHRWKVYEICYKTHTTLPTPPQACCYTTLGNEKFIISADIRQIWKKIQRNIAERFNFLSRVHQRYIHRDDRRNCDSKDPNVTQSRSGKKTVSHYYRMYGFSSKTVISVDHLHRHWQECSSKVNETLSHQQH